MWWTARCFWATSCCSNHSHNSGEQTVLTLISLRVRNSGYSSQHALFFPAEKWSSRSMASYPWEFPLVHANQLFQNPWYNPTGLDRMLTKLFDWYIISRNFAGVGKPRKICRASLTVIKMPHCPLKSHSPSSKNFSESVDGSIHYFCLFLHEFWRKMFSINYL